jgi:PKD repeat protein
MAARWTTPATSTPTYRAMKMFRNYDGSKSGFGDVSVRATTATNPDSVSVFAAQRSSSQAVTVMIVNKVTTSAPVALSLASFTAGASAEVWRLSGSAAIARQADVAVASNAVSLTVPGQSVTLLVVPASTQPPNQPPVASFTASPASGTAPLAVGVDASASTDPDGSIASYAWTFGDGSAATGVSSSHTYASAGTYTITLTVTDDRGATNSTTRSITATALARPAAPTGLTATQSGRRVTLRWTDASSNETGFYVERSARTRTLAFSRIGTTAANATSFAFAESAGTWVYRVQAFNGAGASAYSNVATLRVRYASFAASSPTLNRVQARPR